MAVHRREGGQALILGVLGMTLVLVIAVIVVDFGLWFSGRSSVVNALDQASTAASLKLPTDGAGAEAVALQYAQDNDFDIAAGDVDVTFRCVVGDRNNDGQPDRFDIPAVCPQLTSATFTCINKLCYSLCAFSPPGPPTPRCNTVVVQGQKTVEFGFAPIFGIAGAQAPGFVSAACRGACGGPPTLPLDLVIIIDRTYSMNSDDIDKARNGAESILQLFDPEVQHVALGFLPQSVPANDCQSVSDVGDPGNWIVTPLLDDYQLSDGTLNPSSEIVADGRCLQRSPIQTVSTNLADPIKAAKDFLVANGRPNVKKGIILLTDGAANVNPGTGYLNCSAQAAVTSGSGDNDGFERVASGVNPDGACADGGDHAEDVDSGNGTSTSCTSSQKDRHIFRDYGISIPGGVVVSGIKVRLDASVNSASGGPNMCVQLSWNGGATWTTVTRQTPNLTTAEQTYYLGSTTDTWGRTWGASDFSNANFRVRVTDIADDGGGTGATGTLFTVANGNYTAWTNGESQVDETGTPDCTSGDSVISTGTGSRESFTLSLSGVPDGATITSVDVNVRDRGDSATGGTYQTFTRLNGTDTDSGTDIATTGTSGCSSTRTQNIDVADTVKSGATTLEIGVVKTAINTNTVRVGTISAVVNYVVPAVQHTFSLDWVAVDVHYRVGQGPCDYANQQATGAKTVDPPIEVFTIGFGIEGETCDYETSSSPYDNEDVTMLLADMATDSDDDGGDGLGGLSGGCDNAAEVASENSDGDHFLCLPKTDELVPIFRQAAEQLAGGSRLIKLPASMLP